jgi:uncharacterized iron-regulated membrane protein
MSAVPGSIVRRVLFWAHLCSGVAGGVIILVLSATGVLLTYQRQMLATAEQGNHVSNAPGASALSADRLAELARAASPAPQAFSLIFDSDPAIPVAVQRGRGPPLLLNPYTGAVVPDAAAGQRNFMRTIENWHRWLGGSSTSARAGAVDIANLLFLFMVVSGIYIWLPAVWRWRTLRGLLLFKSHYVNSRMRDFNWHHVFSAWMLAPLFLIALSGVVMSFGWANQALFAIYGEQPAQGQRGPEGGGTARAPDAARTDGAQRASLDALLANARAQVHDWHRLTLPVGEASRNVTISAELRSSDFRPPRRLVTLNASDGSVVNVSAPLDPTPGQRARSWIRFVHTGEEYGVVGQTLAGLASVAACFLVYTGLALAYRRLIGPLFRRPRVPADSQAPARSV